MILFSILNGLIGPFALYLHPAFVHTIGWLLIQHWAKNTRHRCGASDAMATDIQYPHEYNSILLPIPISIALKLICETSSEQSHTHSFQLQLGWCAPANIHKHTNTTPVFFTCPINKREWEMCSMHSLRAQSKKKWLQQAATYVRTSIIIIRLIRCR